MEINFTLSLPRDAMSVPVVRRVLRSAMGTLGVDDDCVSDIEIALTEACTNVLDHVVEGDEYEVRARLHDDVCAIDVIDTGVGFDGEAHGHDDADLGSEDGRGIQLIRALVDTVHFMTSDEDGTVVHFEKLLTMAAGAPLRVLSDRKGGDKGVGDLASAEQVLADREDALASAPLMESS